MEEFSSLVDYCNDNFKDIFLSPLDVLLDEFDGEIVDRKQAINLLVQISEEVVRKNYALKFRFSLREYEVDRTGAVELNQKNLHNLKKLKRKFHFSFSNDLLAQSLDHAFFIFDRFIKDWNEQDRVVAREFFQEEDYKKVAEIIGKDPSSVWRRKKTLKIESYNECKRLIQQLAMF